MNLEILFLRPRAALAMFACLPLVAQQPESVVVYDEGREPIALAYGQSCETDISYPTDLDRFVFCGEQSDRVWVVVQGNYGYMDEQTEIYDPTGALIDSAYCWDQCSYARGITLPMAGTYTVLVQDRGNNEVGRYNLAVERLPPRLNARVLPYNQPINDSLQSGADLDFFAFQAQANAQLRLSVNGSADYMDERVHILDAAGSSIATAYCWDQCSFQINFTVPTTGVYHVMVHDEGLNEAGSYQLSLNVLIGNAPTQRPSAFENLGQADGIAGVCGVPAAFGLGTMATGTPLGLRLGNANPNALALLVAGCRRGDQVMFGGRLVPVPEIVIGGATDGGGHFALDVAAIPPGLAPGYTLFCQGIVLDATAPFGIAASNAVLGVTP